MIRAHSDSAELATVDVVFVRYDDGTSDLLPEPSLSCKSCGLCGAASRESPLLSGTQQTSLRLGLPVRSLIWIAIALYGLPLAGLLAGALVAAALGAEDIGAFAGSLAGGTIAAVIMKRCAGSLESKTIARLRFGTAGSPETQ